MLRIISMAIWNGHLHRPPVPHLVDLEKRATQIFEYAHDAIPAIIPPFRVSSFRVASKNSGFYR